MAITPYLYYEDVEAAAKFLARAFGLRKSGPATKGADGKINHAAMQLGNDVVMMGRPPKGYRNPKRLGQATQCLYASVDDVDRHFARARKAGAIVLQEPGDTPYGHRRYDVEDPEGHQWYFAEDAGRSSAGRKRPRRKA
jgi:uncharacterized glyoxalase superfamily protein PhnB